MTSIVSSDMSVCASTNSSLGYTPGINYIGESREDEEQLELYQHYLNQDNIVDTIESREDNPQEEPIYNLLYRLGMMTHSEHQLINEIEQWIYYNSLEFGLGLPSELCYNTY
jgi:hypothetical protein